MLLTPAPTRVLLTSYLRGNEPRLCSDLPRVTSKWAAEGTQASAFEAIPLPPPHGSLLLCALVVLKAPADSQPWGWGGEAGGDGPRSS